MKTRSLLLGAVASLVFVSAASAYERNGWYIGLEGGGNWVDDTKVVRTFDPNPPGAPFALATFNIPYDSGWAALGTVGYGFNGPFRVELEGGYRDNDTSSVVVGSLTEWSAMVNALYDISLTDKLALSLGVGAGGDHFTFKVPISNFDEGDWQFAYQGIAGLSYELTDRLDLFANYRYFRVSSPDLSGPGNVGVPVGTISLAYDDVVKHTATIGLRYHFGQPAPAPMVAPPPPPPPMAEPVAPPREFLQLGQALPRMLARLPHAACEVSAAGALFEQRRERQRPFRDIAQGASLVELGELVLMRPPDARCR